MPSVFSSFDFAAGSEEADAGADGSAGGGEGGVGFSSMGGWGVKGRGILTDFEANGKVYRLPERAGAILVPLSSRFFGGACGHGGFIVAPSFVENHRQSAGRSGSVSRRIATMARRSSSPR